MILEFAWDLFNMFLLKVQRWPSRPHPILSPQPKGIPLKYSKMNNVIDMYVRLFHGESSAWLFDDLLKKPTKGRKSLMRTPWLAEEVKVDHDQVLMVPYSSGLLILKLIYPLAKKKKKKSAHPMTGHFRYETTFIYTLLRQNLGIARYISVLLPHLTSNS